MKGNCGECGRRWYCEISPGDCNEWPDPVPMTNADRIRSMTDEELAVLLSDPCECSVDPNEDGYRECGNKFCIEYLLNWLQQPAEIFSE